MFNSNSKQIKSSSIVFPSFSQYSLTKNIEAIKGGVGGNGNNGGGSEFIGEYINQ